MAVRCSEAIAVAAYVDTLPGSGYPSRLELLINGELAEAVQVDGLGPVALAAGLPASVDVGGHLHLEVRADHRFVYTPGPSPRTHVYGAVRIQNVRLEE